MSSSSRSAVEPSGWIGMDSSVITPETDVWFYILPASWSLKPPFKELLPFPPRSIPRKKNPEAFIGNWLIDFVLLEISTLIVTLSKVWRLSNEGSELISGPICKKLDVAFNELSWENIIVARNAQWINFLFIKTVRIKDMNFCFC